MSTYNGSVPKKRSSFLIKDILGDDGKMRDSYSSFTATPRRFVHPSREASNHCHEPRHLYQGNDKLLCSCHRPGGLVSCTAPIPIRTPSPKFPCGCQVSASRGRRSQDFLYCQSPNFNQSHLSPLPTRRFPSPHQIKGERVTIEDSHSLESISESTLPSLSTDRGKLLSHTDTRINLSRYFYLTF